MMRKRMLCIGLSLLLCAASVCIVSSKPLPVKASSIAVSTETTIEMLALLWGLLIDGMLICGADSTPLSNYNTGMDLFDAFMEYLHDIVFAGRPEIPDSLSDSLAYAILNGDTYITVEEFLALYGQDNGAALGISEETYYEAYKLIMGGLSNMEPGPPPEPEEPEKEFTKLEQVVINANMVRGVTGFIDSLFAGKIEPLEFSTYGAYFTGQLPRLGNGDYWGFGFGGPSTINGMEDKTGKSSICYDIKTRNPHGVVGFVSNGSGWKRLKVYALDPEGNVYDTTVIEVAFASNDAAVPLWYRVNFPVYDIPAYRDAWLYQGVDKGALNGEVFDFPGLIGSAYETLHPLTGIHLFPQSILDLALALARALNTGGAPASDEDFEKRVRDAVDEYLADMPVPDPVTPPVPVPKPEPEPEPEPEIEYEVDLKNFFPFCLPFDLMHLLETLDAEPVAPRFQFPFVVPALGIDMSIDIDLAFLDSVAEIFRLGETISFIILLIFATGKLIKW